MQLINWKNYTKEAKKLSEHNARVYDANTPAKLHLIHRILKNIFTQPAVFVWTCFWKIWKVLHYIASLFDRKYQKYPLYNVYIRFTACSHQLANK